jgi:hypothetical protein
MPRSEELKALDEAIARDNARRGWRSVKPTPRIPRQYSFIDEEETASAASSKTTRSSECAPENIRIILEAEAAAAEEARQRIARLLQELGTWR